MAFLFIIILGRLCFQAIPNLPWESEVALAFGIGASCGARFPSNEQQMKYDEHARLAQEGCGNLCDATAGSTTSGPFYQQRKTQHVNCSGLWGNERMDDPSPTWPPAAWDQISYDLQCAYSLNGTVRVTENAYWGQKKANEQGADHINYVKDGQPMQWTEERVDNMIEEARQGTLKGSYGVSMSNEVIHAMGKIPSIQGSHVLVIGSEHPWVEAIALMLGAARTTTLEYGHIDNSHPRISVMQPHEARLAYDRGELQFDHVAIISSVEHSGMGRYGDALNPWADVQTVARAWCATKPSGRMVLAVPYGPDRVAFNAQRAYGKLRYPLLTTNWVQKWRTPDGIFGMEAGSPNSGTGGDWQRVHVFERDNSPGYS